MAQLVRNPPVVPETWVQSLGWEDPLEMGMETQSSILCLQNPIEQSYGLCWRGKGWEDLGEWH